jgi:hypothetical protein
VYFEKYIKESQALLSHINLEENFVAKAISPPMINKAFHKRKFDHYHRRPYIDMLIVHSLNKL